MARNVLKEFAAFVATSKSVATNFTSEQQLVFTTLGISGIIVTRLGAFLFVMAGVASLP